jgi:hypothetical protein
MLEIILWNILLPSTVAFVVVFLLVYFTSVR